MNSEPEDDNATIWEIGQQHSCAQLEEISKVMPRYSPMVIGKAIGGQAAGNDLLNDHWYLFNIFQHSTNAYFQIDYCPYCGVRLSELKTWKQESLF